MVAFKQYPDVGSPEWHKQNEEMKASIRQGISNDNHYKATKGVVYKSPLRYPGGKSRATKQIIEQLPPADKRRGMVYIEPMVGGGSVFLAIRSAQLFRSYQINDKFTDLIDFWKTAQDPVACEAMAVWCEDMLTLSVEDRKEYFLAVKKEKFDFRQQRAQRFFYINRCSFSGTTEAGGFSASAAMDRFTLSAVNRLRAMPDALAGVTITNDDYYDLLSRDRQYSRFFFFDPPYLTASKLYGKNGELHTFDHEKFAHNLRYSCGGNFLITYDDCPEIRKLFSWATIVPYDLQYGMDNCGKDKKSKKGSEIFIRNY